METLLDFKLSVRGSTINFEARYITVILTIFGRTKMFENMRIFILENVFIYTYVEMAVGFANVASTTARTSKFVN